MQMAVIEAARSLGGVEAANSTEFGPTPEPVVGLLTEWLRGNELEKRAAGGDLGGTMRLGAFQASLSPGSKVAEIYGGTEISERHRHRYEVNMTYRDRLEQKGLRFSGVSPDGVLPEIVEYDNHPWFIGVQYHPELKSRPFDRTRSSRASSTPRWSRAGWFSRVISERCPFPSPFEGRVRVGVWAPTFDQSGTYTPTSNSSPQGGGECVGVSCEIRGLALRRWAKRALR